MTSHKHENDPDADDQDDANARWPKTELDDQTEAVVDIAIPLDKPRRIMFAEAVERHGEQRVLDILAENAAPEVNRVLTAIYDNPERVEGEE